MMALSRYLLKKIIANHDKAFVIDLVYRPPNFYVTQFTKTFDDVAGEVSQQRCSITGNYDIDLLKRELLPPTEQFLDAMYLNPLLPMIRKPSTETETTETLVDNIFTNKCNINDNTLQSILLQIYLIIIHISYIGQMPPSYREESPS